MSPDSSTTPPDMSPATREILGRVRQMIPPMLEKFHKGVSTLSYQVGDSDLFTN